MSKVQSPRIKSDGKVCYREYTNYGEYTAGNILQGYTVGIYYGDILQGYTAGNTLWGIYYGDILRGIHYGNTLREYTTGNILRIFPMEIINEKC